MRTTVDQYLEGLLIDVRHVSDPAARLVRFRELRDGIDRLEVDLRDDVRRAILDLRAETPARTWEAIGRLLGVSAQRAQQLSRHT